MQLTTTNNAAIGYDPFDPSSIYQYGYGRFSNVITAMEIERMINASGPTGGHVIKPSDGIEPKRVAFIHCVGSRDEQIGKPYCSRVCCMYSMKNAQLCIDWISVHSVKDTKSSTKPLKKNTELNLSEVDLHKSSKMMI